MNEFLIRCIPYAIGAKTHLVNALFFIPEKWKTSIIQPLPNIPLPKGIHFNYKAYSISILPDLSSFETLLVGQMVSYINNVHMYTAEGSVWFHKTS